MLDDGLVALCAGAGQGNQTRGRLPVSGPATIKPDPDRVPCPHGSHSDGPEVMLSGWGLEALVSLLIKPII